MTIKKLLKKLAMFPPEMRVVIRSPSDELLGHNVGRVRMDLGRVGVVRGNRRIRFKKGEGIVLKPDKGEVDMVVIDALSPTSSPRTRKSRVLGKTRKKK